MKILYLFFIFLLSIPLSALAQVIQNNRTLQIAQGGSIVFNIPENHYATCKIEIIQGLTNPKVLFCRDKNCGYLDFLGPITVQSKFAEDKIYEFRVIVDNIRHNQDTKLKITCCHRIKSQQAECRAMY